jgi:hypothetical protein
MASLLSMDTQNRLRQALRTAIITGPALLDSMPEGKAKAEAQKSRADTLTELGMTEAEVKAAAPGSMVIKLLKVGLKRRAGPARTVFPGQLARVDLVEEDGGGKAVAVEYV